MSNTKNAGSVLRMNYLARLRVVVVVAVLSLICCSSIYSNKAVAAVTLDEVINNNDNVEYSTESESKAQESNDGVKVEGTDIVSVMKEASTIRINDEDRIMGFIGAVAEIVSPLTVGLFIIASLLIGLSIGIDVVYIGVPFTRGALNPNQSSKNSSNTHNSMYSSGNMQSGSGYGGYGGQGDGSNGGTSSRKFVSESAIAVVNMAEADSNSGNRVKGMWFTYGKSAFARLIAVPILATLVLSGLAANIGYFLGEKLGSILQFVTSW